MSKSKPSTPTPETGRGHKKIKILMLHGYTSNAAIFSKKMGAVRKTCKDVADFIFLDGPHVVSIPTYSSSSSSTTDADTSTAINSTSDTPDPSLLPRGWWLTRDAQPQVDKDASIGQGPAVYEGFDESLKLVKEVWDKEGGFDAVWGFSQGGAFASLVTAFFLRPSLHPAFSSDITTLDSPSSTPIRPLRFTIITSGFRSRDLSHQPYFQPIAFNSDGQGKTTEILHIIGHGDTIVGKDRTLPLVEATDKDSSRVEYHEGGHFVPYKPSWRSFYKEFIALFQSSEDKAPSELQKELDAIVSPSKRGVVDDATL